MTMWDTQGVLLQNHTPLQVYWMAQMGLVLTALANYVITGTFWDKSADMVKGGKLGLFQFNKRIALFYTFAVVWCLYLLWTVLAAYCYGTPPNFRVQQLIDFTTAPKKQSVDVTCAFVALCLFLLHMVQRFYESTKVSVFSHKQTIGPLGLLLSYAYYVAAGLSLVADAPNLMQQTACLDISSLNWYHILAVILFVAGSILQNKAHKIFAKLRKNKAGHIVTTSYRMPKGDVFDKTSNPHYLGEVLIYLAIGCALGMHSPTWWWITAYVAANQLYLAYNTHKLYLAKFEDYPKHRKMLVPFLL